MPARHRLRLVSARAPPIAATSAVSKLASPRCEELWGCSINALCDRREDSMNTSQISRAGGEMSSGSRIDDSDSFEGGVMKGLNSRYGCEIPAACAGGDSLRQRLVTSIRSGAGQSSCLRCRLPLGEGGKPYSLNIAALHSLNSRITRKKSPCESDHDDIGVLGQHIRSKELRRAFGITNEWS